MKNKKESQCAQIYEFMKLHGDITQEIAVIKFSCYRLSARIWDLRHRGIDINVRMAANRKNGGFHAVYSLGEVAKG